MLKSEVTNVSPHTCDKSNMSSLEMKFCKNKKLLRTTSFFCFRDIKKTVTLRELILKSLLCHAPALYITSIITTCFLWIMPPHFFSGSFVCRQSRPSPSIGCPCSEISQTEMPAFRSRSFLGGASSAKSNSTSEGDNSNPTSGHLKVNCKKLKF